ncbi:MAG: formate dehydrogenase subunit delta [Rhodocyclales bacterium]|nr:formate dehydrogenase subunit delta [Rhodocyclales bacterium]
MSPAKLIRMANQIGAFFDAMPDREQAARDVASHIRRHWTSRMRAELRAHIDHAGDGELTPLVCAALPLIR